MQHNHQLHNAAFLAAHGAAILVEQKELARMNMEALLTNLFEKPSHLRKMSVEAKALSHPDHLRTRLLRILRL